MDFVDYANADEAVVLSFERWAPDMPLPRVCAHVRRLGFVLARRGNSSPKPTVPPAAPPLRFLDQRVLDAATVFADDVRARELEPSTLEHPRIVDDMRHGWC